MPQQQRPPRVSFYLDEETKSAFDFIMQHYGITSQAAGVRRAIVEHAKSLKEPVKPAGKVTLSRRVY